MLINAPAARTVAEVVDDGMGGCEGFIPVVAANGDVILVELYNVWKAVSGGVTEEVQFVIEAPISSVVGEREAPMQCVAAFLFFFPVRWTTFARR